MKFKIAVIPGDGIGPEIVAAAQNVMEGISEKFGHEFEYEEVLLGGVATDACGKSYPDGTAERCKACDAVLLGAVGTPKYGSDKPAEQRPAGHPQGSGSVRQPPSRHASSRSGGYLPAAERDGREGH